MVTIRAALRSVHGESDDSLKPIVDALSASGYNPESEAVVAPCLHYIKPPLLCLWGLACVSSQCCLFALSTSRILHSEEVHLPEGDCYGTAPPQSGGYDWSYLGCAFTLACDIILIALLRLQALRTSGCNRSSCCLHHVGTPLLKLGA